MKILLVAPPYSLMNKYYFPVGIAYVSAMLKHNGFDVACHNNGLESDWEGAFLKSLREAKPDVLGIGGLTPSYKFIKRMLEIAKAENPSLVTVLGGGVLSSEPDVFPCLAADFGVMGEGELVSLELMGALQAGRDVTNISGVLYRKADGSIVATKPRSYIANLDEIPIPDYHGFNFDVCYQALHTHDMISSRGCPFHCTFCYSALGRGKFRFHSLDYVIKEIEYLIKEFGIQTIGLMDEVFALKKDRILEFCEKVTPYGLSWYTQVRLEVVDDELLKAMKRAGCSTVFYGLESMSPVVLNSMNKKLKPEQTIRALEQTYDNGINSFGNFIFGDPAETTETSWETLDWWLDNRKHFVNLGKIDCWPGTKIYHQAVEKGIIKDKIRFIEERCPTVNLTDMPQDEFMDMLKRVWVLHEAMLWPAKLMEASMDDPDDLKAVCRCPHCKKDQHYSGLQNIPMNGDRNAHRMYCPTCSLKFDIPLRFPSPKHAPEVETLFADAVAHYKKGNNDAAMEDLKKLYALTLDHPVAAFLGVTIRLAQKQYALAKELSRITLKHNPSAPYLLEIAAVAYRRHGDVKIAFAFLEQAGLLRATRALVITPETVAKLDPMEHLCLTLFQVNAQTTDIGLSFEE